MRFAVLGNHPDGLAVARALCATGRHELAMIQGSEPPGFAPNARAHPDLEEVLANADIETVIVAGALTIRAEQLRRALQSEHNILCVHPCSDKPDSAYESALIRDDTKRRLLPLLPDALHPAYQRLRELFEDEKAGFCRQKVPFRLLHWESWTRGSADSEQLGLPWSIFRFIGGEVIEVSGLTIGEEIQISTPFAASGVFERGGMFEATHIPNAIEDRHRLTIHGDLAIAILDGPDADGKANLRWRSVEGEWQEQSWSGFDRWQPMIEIIESVDESTQVSWQDEIRSLELADAFRRSVEKRRTSSLEYQEISEEVGSKGTLTLIGCAMIWVILLIFMLSIWVPWIRWAIVPLIVGFLVLVGLSILARDKPK